MAANATAGDFYKTSTTPGTPVALGASTVRFHALTLHGYKSAGTANTSDVKFRPTGGSGWITIPTETSWTVPIPEGCQLDASQFEIDVATSGDGVLATYFSKQLYTGA